MSASDASASQPFNGLFLAAHSNQMRPFYEGKSVLIDGQLEQWTGEVSTIYSPILQQSRTQRSTSQHHTQAHHSHTPPPSHCLRCVAVVGGERIAIGVAPQMGEAEALRAVHSAAKAYGHGLGYWPTCGVAQRIRVIQSYISALQERRDQVVSLLMWEICKTREDSEKEVDRTIQYIKDTIVELKKIENSSSTYEVVQGVVGHIRRAPLGTVLCLGPFNYPLNETYTTFIPALIMGNTVVMKGAQTHSHTHSRTCIIRPLPHQPALSSHLHLRVCVAAVQSVDSHTAHHSGADAASDAAALWHRHPPAVSPSPSSTATSTPRQPRSCWCATLSSLERRHPSPLSMCTVWCHDAMGCDVMRRAVRVDVQLPKTGCLAHLPTIELFARIFPPGVVNIISGAGYTTTTHPFTLTPAPAAASASAEQQQQHPITTTHAITAWPPSLC